MAEGGAEHAHDAHGGAHVDHHHGGLFHDVLHFTNQAGSWILLIGIAIALLNFALLVVQYFTGLKLNILFAITQGSNCSLTLDRIKLELARIVAFSLLLLVAADVLETLLQPMHDVTMEELYKMALVGGIRTTLAYFLGKEMEEIMHHIEHSEHGHDHDSHDDHAHGTEDKHAAATKSITNNHHDDEVEELTTTTPANNKKKNKKKKAS